MRWEDYDIAGTGTRPYRVYYMPKTISFWDAVTDVGCPRPGCWGLIVEYESIFLPGYVSRICDVCNVRYLAIGDMKSPRLLEL